MSQTFILSASLIIQLAAALMAVRLIRVTGRPSAWIALALAIVLMGARRAITLYELVVGGSQSPASASVAEIVAFVISALMLGAVLAIEPVFRSARSLGDIENRLGRVLGNSLHEIYVFRASDLRFTQVNLGARQNLGYTKDECSRMTPLDLKPYFTEREFREMLLPLERGEVERHQFTTVHRRKDGTEYTIDLDLQITEEADERVFIGFAHDSSDRARAEAALARSEAHFRSLIENAQDVITVLNADGTIAYHSPSVERVLGYSAESRVGLDAMERVHPDDLARTREALRTVLEQPGTRNVTYRVRHRDGSWRTLEAIGCLREGVDGPPQIIVNQRDITAREFVEAQLRQAQKLETIGTLAGGVAHDFNNFLTPILGFAELIKRDAKEKAPAGIDEIITAGERARKVIQQILTFSRHTKSERRPVCFSTVVNEAVTLVRATFPSNITVIASIDPYLGFVLADCTQLHQIIMNICTNALQAMPDGGSLTLAAGREEIGAQKRSDPTSRAQGSYVTLTILDTGTGMDQEVVDRVFEPFFTTKDVGEGTGLGLAVAHGILAAHEGDVHVESELGKGTVFRLRFPCAEANPVKRPDLPLTRGGTERILVIDDETAVTRYLQTMLGLLGYEVETANRAQDALDKLSRAIDGVDLVITDLTMPEMSGLKLASQLKELRGDLPIILMSGYENHDTAQTLSAGTINAILAKPFHSHEVAQTIRRVLGSAAPLARRE